MNIFNMLGDIIEDRNLADIEEITQFSKNLEEGRYVFRSKEEQHCLDCKNFSMYQSGRKTSSPYFSYIKCKIINRKVLLEPQLTTKRIDIRGFYIPIECPYTCNDSEGTGKLFYTKCGKKFRKQSNARVTGYEYNCNDEKCKICPFAEKERRYRNKQEVTVHECKAGEREPNKKNDYYTSNENNATSLCIRSVDWNWLESIKVYAEKYDFIVSVYYTQDLPDCRKSLSIGFQQNKGGVSAKKHLIHKYFHR